MFFFSKLQSLMRKLVGDVRIHLPATQLHTWGKAPAAADPGGTPAANAAIRCCNVKAIIASL